MENKRQFEDKLAKREAVPLLLGLVGASSSGKTFSALRLAIGIQRIMGGEIYYIDTESRRALHYSDRFKFRHVDFKEPFGPLDYLNAINHCVNKGAKVVIVDSATHEHSSSGGVMDQSEKFLDKYGEDESARQRNFARSLIKPKRQRKVLNDGVVHIGAQTAFIFCYRAAEKMDYKKKDAKGNLREKGYVPETTSPLIYEMAQQFLLMPGCDGVPVLMSDKKEEKQMIKNPIQFRDWFKPGVQLSEDIGERFARWAAGEVNQDGGPEGKSFGKIEESSRELLKDYLVALAGCRTIDALKTKWEEVSNNRSNITKADLETLTKKKDEIKGFLA